MISLFPSVKSPSPIDQKQGRLLTLALFIVLIFALLLSFSSVVRFHGQQQGYRVNHWIGVLVWIGAFGWLNYHSSLKLPKRDPYILPIVSLLTGIGLMTIWRLFTNMGLRQSIWIVIASSIVSLGIEFPSFIEYLRRYKYIWLSIGLLLTGLTFLIGTNPSGNGPLLWIELLGIHFQPSEFLKLFIITFLASFFTDRLVAVQKKFIILLPTLFVIGAALVLLFFQRDLGTAIIFLLIFLGFIFSKKGNHGLFVIVPIAAFITIFLAYSYIDIVRVRIDTWIDPFGDPSGASYQILQSMIAIAEGGIIGTGPGLGSPSLVPVSLSDFIFSAISEELGLLGAGLVIFLFIFLIYRALKLMVSNKHTFDRYLALGLAFYFGIQSSLIIGGNIGLLPLTGVTLPFVSYGGSSLVVSFIGMLLLMVISSRSENIPQKEFSQQRRPIVLSLSLIVILSFEMVVTSLESFWFMSPLISRPENPRWVIDDRFSERGEILDRKNQIIITNSGEIGSYQRESNHTPLYPIIGYTNATYGQTGIEETMFEYLRGLEGYPASEIFWQDLLFNQPPSGLDVRLTIDLDLQKAADSLLGNESGAIVLMNAQTGEILAMASHPYFDARNLEENWEDLINDPSAPLINRVTQGLYPPGAVLFPYIATSEKDLIRENDQPGIIMNGDLDLDTCAAFPGLEPTWQSLISNGCQSIQAALAKITGVNNILDLYQNLNFFSPPDLRLNVAQADPPDVEDQDALYSGEGTFNLTPLQVALAASALTNQGILPAPRIVNGYQNSHGDWITLPKLGQNIQAVDTESSLWITNLLEKPDSPYWQVISVLNTEDDQSISWFIAGTIPDWQGQPTAVVVLLERNAPDLAEKIGLTLLDQTIQASPVKQ